MTQADFHSKLLLLTTSDDKRRDVSSWACRLRWKCNHVSNHRDLFQALKRDCFDLLILDEVIDGGNSLLHLPEIRELSSTSTIVSINTFVPSSNKSTLLEEIESAYVDHVLAYDFGRTEFEAILIQSRYQKLHKISPNHALVIDDCRTIRKFVMKILKEHQYRVSEARSAEEALERSDLGHVHILITDIFMPGMGGLEAIQRIKATHPEIAIVAMSAGDRGIEISNVLKAAKKIGADAVLSKPFDERQLIDQIEALLKVRYLAA